MKVKANMPAHQVFAAGNSYLGLAGQASHRHQDRVRFAHAAMARGHAVRGNLKKIERRTG